MTDLKWRTRTWLSRPGREAELRATSNSLGLRVIFHQWADEDTVTVRTVTGDAWRKPASFHEFSKETLPASIGDDALAQHGQKLINILSLSPADIDAARERARVARATRAGVSRIDFTLLQIDGKTRTLDTAKAYLLQICAKEKA